MGKFNDQLTGHAGSPNFREDPQTWYLLFLRISEKRNIPRKYGQKEH
jgi:hypothetical protein